MTLINAFLIFLLVFTPFAFGTTEMWSITIFELTSALLALIWFFRMVSSRKFSFAKTALGPLVLVFIAVVLYQLILPASQYCNATRLELYKLLAYAAVYFVVVNSVTSRRDVDRIISVIMAVGFLLAVLAILQKFSGATKIYWMRDISAASKTFFGPYVNKNHFAGYMEMVIPFAMGYLFARGREFFRPGQWLLSVFAVSIMVFSLLLTQSRAGSVSFLCAFALFYALSITKKTVKGKLLFFIAISALLVVMVAWVGRDTVRQELRSTIDYSDGLSYTSRVSVWSSTVNYIKDYKFFGSGLGTFRHIFPQYRNADITKYFSHAHNDYLELLAETGLVGFLVLIAGVILWLRKILRRLMKRHDPYAINIAIGGLSAIFAILIHSLIDFNLHIPANVIILVVIIALTTIAVNSKLRSQDCHPRDPLSGIQPLSGFIESSYLDFETFKIKKYRIFYYPFFALVFIIYSYLVITPYIAHRFASPPPAPLSSPKSSIGDPSVIRNLLLALKYNPSNADYHYQLAETYYGLFPKTNDSSYFMLAIDEYRAALKLDIHNSKYWQSLAWLYANLSRFSPSPSSGLSSPKSSIGDPVRSSYALKAERYFNNAISCEPKSAYRHRAFAQYCFRVYSPLPRRGEGQGEGDCFLSNHYLSLALKHYRKALEIDPSFITEALDLYSKFTTNYNDLEKIIPDTHQAHYQFGKYLQEKGQQELGKEEIEIAVELLREQMKKKPNDYLNRTLYVECLADLGLYGPAMKEAEYLIRKYPREAEGYRLKAVVYEKQGDYEKSIAYMKENISKCDDPALLYFSIADRAFYKREKYSWAFIEQNYNQAFRYDPDNNFYRLWYGIHLSYLKRYDLAREQFKLILAKDANNREAQKWITDLAVKGQ